MDMGLEAIQIGRMAERTGISVDAIRFYEKQGLLARPPRTDGGYRRYGPHDVERILFIRRAQQLGFSLPEIRELIILRTTDKEPCSHVRDLLRAKLARVRNGMKELAFLEAELASDLRKCERKLKKSRNAHDGNCPALEEIANRGVRENRSPVLAKLPKLRTGRGNAARRAPR